MTTIAVSKEIVSKLDSFRLFKKALKSGGIEYETNEEVLDRILSFVGDIMEAKGELFDLIKKYNISAMTEPHKTLPWNVGRKEKVE